MEEKQEEPIEEKKSKREAIKQWFIKHKFQIMKFSIVITLVAGFTIGCFFLFDSLGLLNKNELSETMGDKGAWIYVIFVALFLLQAICLCLVPGNTTLFITVGALVFEDNFWIVLLLCVVGVWLSGIALFWIGRFGGRKVLCWLFPKEKLDKYLDMLTRKGSFVLPGLFLIPFMPNDLMCMLCGTSKLKFWQFLLIIIPCRIIEVLIILCYPLLAKFFIENREPQDILIFVNIAVIDLLLLLLYYRTLIRIFKKTILRKKYVRVEKPYMVEEEVKGKK